MGDRLAAVLAVGMNSGLRLRVATVSVTSPLTVTTATGGDMLVTGRLASYTPVVGQVVLMLVNDRGSMVVLGQVVGP